MCGIGGIVVANGSKPDGAALNSIIQALTHRGPDDHGEWSDEKCAIGHRRLSIIDLSPAGRQPMSNEDGTVWITLNGEIYNFQELRADLEKLGHRFHSHSDTEVIVHAYEQWDVECLKRLRGMFAFAIWDQNRRRLFLARDRVGKKPLFYTLAGGRFLFASELQGLLADPAVPREVNLGAIDLYLSWGYVPAPETAFKGIFKLPPAHFLLLDLNRSVLQPRVERYWSLEYEPKLAISEQEAIEELREKLTKAVELRMISDVPIGAFLSGGIDSSIVAGLMARLSNRPVKTFSIGFKEAAFNELDHARRVAERIGAEHHEFVVEPDALAILPKLVRHYGEPYADSSAVPTYYVSQMTRAEVTVALNGDGGDESFAGYERYLGNRIAERLQSVPGAAWPARTIGQLLPDSFGAKSRVRTAKRFLSVATQPEAVRYGHWIGYFHSGLKDDLYSSSMRAELPTVERRWIESLFEARSGLDPVDAAMAVDVNSYLPFDLLVKVDITSMANGLEARSPLLDHEVMEFAARLPVEMKLRGRVSKYLLKRAFDDLLPPENVNRRKMGFGVPVGEWFRGSLRSFIKDALLSGQAMSRDYFQPATVERLLDEHLERRNDHSGLLWNLMMLELWHREFIQ
jgi:asparagine synthase (glutamine-hydrolysing)